MKSKNDLDYQLNFKYFRMSFYRKAMWFYKSWQDYTQTGFAEAAKNFSSTDLDVDLKGKSFMITGNNIHVVYTHIYNSGACIYMVTAAIVVLLQGMHTVNLRTINKK